MLTLKKRPLAAAKDGPKAISYQHLLARSSSTDRTKTRPTQKAVTIISTPNPRGPDDSLNKTEPKPDKDPTRRYEEHSVRAAEPIGVWSSVAILLLMRGDVFGFFSGLCHCCVVVVDG